MEFNYKNKKILNNRLENLIYIFNNKEFPFVAIAFEMPKLRIKNKFHCEGRISEVCDILELSYKKSIEIIKTNNQEIKKEKIILDGN